MTADRPPQPPSSSPPLPPRSPRRSSTGPSVNAQYARAFQYHSPGGSSSTSSQPASTPKPPAKPLGPRSPEPSSTSRRGFKDQPGSSRTRYYAALPAHPTSPMMGTRGIHEPPQDIHSFSPRSGATVTVGPATDADVDMDAPHAPYRPPEAVIEPEEENPPPYPPGVVAEHIGEDDEVAAVSSSPLRERISSSTLAGTDRAAWQDGMQDSYGPDTFKSDSIERPQLGPGVLPRRWLALVHEHELVQPDIHELPQPAPKRPLSVQSAISEPPHGSPTPLSHPPTVSDISEPPSTSAPAPSSPIHPVHRSSTTSLPDYEHICTIADIHDALPGGQESRHEWYFCKTCWSWFRIVAGRGQHPQVDDMETWRRKVQDRADQEPRYWTIARSPGAFNTAFTERAKSWTTLNDVLQSRNLALHSEHHLHELPRLVHPVAEERIERIKVPDELDAFPHITMGALDDDPFLSSFPPPTRLPTLYLSCSSDLWVLSEQGPPGQLSSALVKAFTAEKMSNPSPGLSGENSVNEAWTLLLTLLGNALFKGQRGWVNLNNPRFANKMGMSIASSHLLYQVGFACRQEAENLRVGPVQKSDKISQDEVLQMDRYMLRAWVEIHLYLSAFQKRCEITGTQAGDVRAMQLEDQLGEILQLRTYPKHNVPYSDAVKGSCDSLGITKWDVAVTVERAYELQCACCATEAPRWFGALQTLSQQPIQGKGILQLLVATERSLGKFASVDLDEAYRSIGYNGELIGVDAEDAPEDYILSVHKSAMGNTTSAAERQRLSEALVLIGKARGSATMQRLGEGGQTSLSVDEAYAALSAPRDSIDDGLIMQYEMAVADFPGKTDHYRMCLDIIANSPGEERPGLKAYLSGAKEEVPPPRKDIPVGLHNIGNTCYLNSILQYLYSIKPLREAVLSFEQDTSVPPTPRKPEVERSRRFVRQLRLLFLQLYKSEQPAVRPDEELAYLAITRPEVDQYVEPPTVTAAPITLDSIPDIPNAASPSSTAVATPSPPPMSSELPPSMTSPPSSHSILGKRVSEDRDSDGSSPEDRTRRKSEGVDADLLEEQVESPTAMETEREEGTETDGLETISPARGPDSPSVGMDLAGLDLKSPEREIPTSQAEQGDEMPSIVPAGRGEVEESFEPPSVPPPLPPRPMARRESTLASGLRFGLQQDSAEVLINVLSQLELAFDPDPTPADNGERPLNLIQSLFSCKYRQQMFYQSESGAIEAQEPVESVFVHPIIGVEEEGKDLYDCLAELYLRGSEIEYEGKKGYIMDLMDRFPPMLYIQMRRSQFDLATGRERKTNTHIAFDQTLAMDRFLATEDSKLREQSIEITREVTRVRARLHQLRNHKPMSIPSTFEHAQDSLAQLQDLPELGITQDFLDALDNEKAEVTAEIISLEEQLKELKRSLDGLWEGKREVEYELVAVYMHRGKTSGAGHYWTYQAWLPEHGDQFFKYNDETVTSIPKDEVLEDRTGSDANPALLCYVRKGQGLIDTLHREILEREEIPVVEGEGEGAPEEVEVVMSNVDKDIEELL